MVDITKMSDAELDAYIAQQQQAVTQLQGSVDRSAATLERQEQAAQDGKRGLLSTAKAWVGGADKDPSIPVWGESIGEKDLGIDSPLYEDPIGTAIYTSFDDQSLMSAIKNVMPEAKFQPDQFGNLVVGAPIRNEQGEIIQYKKFYPNPKGLDAPTIAQTAGVAALAGPVEKGIGAVGLPVTGYKGAVATGMAEAGLLESMSSQAGDRPFRLSEIPSGAFGGALGKGVIDAGGMIFNLAKAFKGKPEEFVTRSKEVELAIVDAGFDPKVVMPEVRSEIERMVREGLDPLESSRAIMAESLPHPVHLTKGQTTGVKSQQLFEDAASGGGYGQVAESRMAQRSQQQQEAIAQNIPAIQAKMAGKDIPIQRSEGMSAAQVELVRQKEVAEQAYKDAYKGAGGTGSFAIPENAEMGIAVIGDRLSAFREVSSPAAFSLAKELGGMLKEGRSLKELFEFRKSISALSAAGGTEAGAAGALKGAFDDILIEQAEKGLLYGNPADVAAGLDAIAKFKEFKQVWETKGVLTTLTTKEMRDGEMVLKVAPEDAANAILGKSIAQSTSKFNLTRDLLTLRKQLPEEQWNQVRQEVFINLADTMHRTGKVDKEASLLFNKSWRNLKEKNPSMVKTLFNKEEISLIDKLAGTSALVAGAAKNTSNSATAAMGAFQLLANSLGASGGMQMLLRVKGMDALTNMAANMRLIPALQGGVTPAARAAQTFSVGLGTGATMGMDSPIIKPLEQGLMSLQTEE